MLSGGDPWSAEWCRWQRVAVSRSTAAPPSGTRDELVCEAEVGKDGEEELLALFLI